MEIEHLEKKWVPVAQLKNNFKKVVDPGYFGRYIQNKAYVPVTRIPDSNKNEYTQYIARGGKGLSGLREDLRYVRFVMNLRKAMTRKRERKREASRPARTRTRTSRAKGGVQLAKGGKRLIPLEGRVAKGGKRALGGQVAKGGKRPRAVSAGTKLDLTGLRYGTPLNKEALAGLEEKNINSYPEHGDYANLLNWYFRGGKVDFIPTISGRHWGMRMSELPPGLRGMKFIGDLHREIDRYKEQKKKQTTGGDRGTAADNRSASSRPVNVERSNRNLPAGSAGSNRGSAGSGRGSAGSSRGSAGSNRGSAGSSRGSAGSGRGSAGSGRNQPAGYPVKKVFKPASELKLMFQNFVDSSNNLNPHVIYTTRMIPNTNITEYKKYPPGTNFANLPPALRYVKYVFDTRERMSRDRKRKFRKQKKVDGG